jgi:hypothetical protein
MTRSRYREGEVYSSLIDSGADVDVDVAWSDATEADSLGV